MAVLEQEISDSNDFESEDYHKIVEELSEYANKLAVLGSSAIEANS